jgi:hypothetical protein
VSVLLWRDGESGSEKAELTFNQQLENKGRINCFATGIPKREPSDMKLVIAYERITVRLLLLLAKSFEDEPSRTLAALKIGEKKSLNFSAI